MLREVRLLYARFRELVSGLTAVAAGWRRFAGIILGVLLAATVSASSVTYTYDELGRLKSATYDNGSGTGYALDAAGNRKTVTQTIDRTAPAAPLGLAGSATSATNIHLTWSICTDTTGAQIAGYKIYRGTPSPLTQIGTSATASYDDGTVVGSSQYTYTVACYDNAAIPNTSAQSAPITVNSLDTTPPAIPTGLTGSAPLSTTVNLTWTASTDTGGSGLVGYKIYRAGAQIGTSATSTYSDTTTQGTTSYSYTVAAYDNAGNTSAQSTTFPITTPDTIAPSVPLGLSGSAPASGTVNLSWSGATDTGGSGLAGYKIYRGNPTPFAQIGTSATASYTDSTTLGTTSYTYTVAAYDNAGNTSSQSSGIGVTTPDTIPPSVPTGVSATAVSANQVNVSWTASVDTGGAGMGGYNIWRNGAYKGTASATSYVDTAVGGGTTYSYTIQAFDAVLPAANYSAQSSPPAVVTTPSDIPSVPGTPAPHGKVLTITWTESWAASTGPVAYYTLQQLQAGVLQASWNITAPNTTSAQSGQNGASYQYKVQACNSSNQCSGFSPTSMIQICAGGTCP